MIDWSRYESKIRDGLAKAQRTNSEALASGKKLREATSDDFVDLDKSVLELLKEAADANLASEITQKISELGYDTDAAVNHAARALYEGRQTRGDQQDCFQVTRLFATALGYNPSPDPEVTRPDLHKQKTKIDPDRTRNEDTSRRRSRKYLAGVGIAVVAMGVYLPSAHAEHWIPFGTTTTTTTTIPPSTTTTTTSTLPPGPLSPLATLQGDTPSDVPDSCPIVTSSETEPANFYFIYSASAQISCGTSQISDAAVQYVWGWVFATSLGLNDGLGFLNTDENYHGVNLSSCPTDWDEGRIECYETSQNYTVIIWTKTGDNDMFLAIDSNVNASSQMVNWFETDVNS